MKSCILFVAVSFALWSPLLALGQEIDGDEHWKHVIHCAPCYQEYLDLRVAFRLSVEAKVVNESR